MSREWVLVLYHVSEYRSLAKRVSIYRLCQRSGTYDSWLLLSMDIEVHAM